MDSLITAISSLVLLYRLSYDTKGNAEFSTGHSSSQTSVLHEFYYVRTVIQMSTVVNKQSTFQIVVGDYFNISQKKYPEMKTISVNIEEHERVHSGLIQQQNQEYVVTAALTSEILSKLNISIDVLPQKCQQLLLQAAEAQHAMDINQLDPIAISLHQTKEMSQKLEDEYEILKLKQKNVELQAKIDRNNKFLEGLRKELQNSQDSLASQNPNPENIQDCIRQFKQKVVSYEESCEKAKAKFSKLSVPEAILPASLTASVATLVALREEAAALKLRADDVALAREARDTFIRLRR